MTIGSLKACKRASKANNDVVNTSELRDITCHMGSYSVTCHTTQMNAHRLAPAIFPYPGGMEG